MQVDPNSVPTLVGKADIVIQSAAVAYFVKPTVDIIKKIPISTPPWSLPMFAWGIGILFAFLLNLSSGGSLTLQIAATNIMVGLLGGTGAIAVTELHRKANENEPDSTSTSSS